MAQTTTNYGLYKPEATDTYNHLVYDNPNMDTIDATMKDNSNHGVDSATCIKSGTVHSVTRTNTSCPVFKFTATGDWNTGDTMNVDGTPVSVFLPNGTAPLTNCFVINTEVMASISGSRVTLYCPVIPDASDVVFDNSNTTLTSVNVQGALEELNDANNIKFDSTHSVYDMISTSVQIPTNLEGKTYTAANEKDFLLQVLTDVLDLAPGKYMFRCVYSGGFFATVVACTYVTATRGTIEVIPVNSPNMYYVTQNNIGSPVVYKSPAFTVL